MMIEHGIRLVRAEDWEGLYVGGYLRSEARRVTIDDVLAAIGVRPSEVLYVDPVWLLSLGYLPAYLTEVRLSSRPLAALSGAVGVASFSGGHLGGHHVQT